MSLAADVGGLDYRPPLRDLVLLIGGKGFRRPLSWGRDLLADILQPLNMA
jgi:hypothetical protein